MVRIDVFWDVVSPWCYIGKRRLEGALRAPGGKVETEVRWRAFECDPKMPRAGVDRRATRPVEAIDARVAEVGRAEGLAFAFSRIERIPNTFDAHRLVALARLEGAEELVVEGLFHAYFVEGRDVSRLDTLLDLAAGAGLDRDRVAADLQGNAGAAELRRDEAKGRALGITLLPHFVLGDALALSWGLDSATIALAIEQVAGGIMRVPGSSEGRHGFERTRCGCELCKSYCKHIPGRLDIEDLLRLCPQGEDVFAWAEQHLRAVVDKPYPKLVPARQANGHCQWFHDGGCMVHANAPYGCAYFDAHMSPREVQRRGDAASRGALADAVREGLFYRVWRHLRDRGLVRPSGNRGPLDEEIGLIQLSMDRVQPA